MLSRVMDIHLGLKNPMRSVYFICALSFVFFLFFLIFEFFLEMYFLFSIDLPSRGTRNPMVWAMDAFPAASVPPATPVRLSQMCPTHSVFFSFHENPRHPKPIAAFALTDCADGRPTLRRPRDPIPCFSPPSPPLFPVLIHLPERPGAINAMIILFPHGRETSGGGGDGSSRPPEPRRDSPLSVQECCNDRDPDRSPVVVSGKQDT